MLEHKTKFYSFELHATFAWVYVKAYTLAWMHNTFQNDFVHFCGFVGKILFAFKHPTATQNIKRAFFRKKK